MVQENESQVWSKSVNAFNNISLELIVVEMYVATAVSLLTERDWRPLLMELVLGKT